MPADFAVSSVWGNGFLNIAWAKIIRVGKVARQRRFVSGAAKPFLCFLVMLSERVVARWNVRRNGSLRIKAAKTITPGREAKLSWYVSNAGRPFSNSPPWQIGNFVAVHVWGDGGQKTMWEKRAVGGGVAK